MADEKIGDVGNVGGSGSDLDILKSGSDGGASIKEDPILPEDEVIDDEKDEGSEEETEGSEEETEETEEEDSEESDDDDEVDETESESKDEEVEAASETFRSIKKYDPKFFKKFPWVAAALNREKDYTNAFGSVQDAKEAAEKLGNFAIFENSLMEGDPSLLISTMKDASPESLKKVAENFVPALIKLDPSMARTAISPIIKQVLRRATQDAERTGNDNLRKAAAWIAKYTAVDLEKSDAAPSKTDDREKELQQRELAINNRLLDSYDSEVNHIARTGLTREVERALDPERKMSKFAREALVEKIVSTIDSQLGKDKSHLSGMENLWRQAMRSGLDPSFKQKIASAYLGRAKTLIPTIKRQLSLSSGNNGNERKEKRNIPSSGGRGSTKVSSGKFSVTEARKQKMSDEDILKAP